ncbi:MAG: zinc ribbon domain-containing protein [Acidobacteria bacterium]|nr:zinc ribbon domain-containing protein [Acidobacteriota bacterium]
MEIPSGSSGTFSQREADVRPMARQAWEELVGSITPPRSNAIDGPAETDAKPLYLLVWLGLVLLTLPFGMKLRRRRLAARAAGASGDARFCPRCGMARGPGAGFCASCGRPLTTGADDR